MGKCNVYKLGVVEYSKAYEAQKNFVERKLSGQDEDFLLLLEHPPTITLGKSGRIENIIVEKAILEKNNIALHFVDRGGDVTYHGPGQLVGYPIVDIEEKNLTFHDYIYNLEQTIIDTLFAIGLKSYRKENHRGVWTDSGKIASLGIRIVKKITMHGFALNVNTNLDHFNFIIPCGLSNERTTSIFEITRKDISMNEIMSIFEESFSKVFKYEMVYDTQLA